MPQSQVTFSDLSTRLTGTAKVRAEEFSRWIREAQWFIAFLASLVGVGVAFLMVLSAGPIARAMPAETWVTDVTEARSVLLAFIGVEITALSIVMSLTMITLQNAASQFSNRLLRYYVRDKVQQTVLGVIAGATAYFVTVAAILGLEGTGEVPRPSLGLAVLFLMASGVALIVQVNHTMQIVRLEIVLGRVVKATRAAFDRIRETYSGVDYVMGAALPLSDRAVPVLAHMSGYVAFEEVRSLLRMATHHGYMIRVDVEVGNHAVKGQTVGWVEPSNPDEPIPESLLLQVSESMGFNELRNPSVDAGLGFRLLVDIALKALSPAVNDPYSAAKSVDHIATILISLVGQDLGERTLLDMEGNPRVQLCGRTLIDYLALAADQLARYGAREPVVILRLIKLARDVGSAAQSEDDRAGVLRVVDQVMLEVEREMRDPDWLARLRELSAEAKSAISAGVVSRAPWPTEL